MHHLALTSDLPPPCTIHLTCHGSAPPRATITRIDVFAVRQWPGNGADLDFRGVLKGCTAAIVAAAPIEGTLLNGEEYNGKKDMRYTNTREAFLKSDEYAAVATVLPFCRLWCVREGGHLSPLSRPSAIEPDPTTNLALSPTHPSPPHPPRHHPPTHPTHPLPPTHSYTPPPHPTLPPTPNHHLPIPGAWWRWRRCWRWRNR